MNRSLVVGSGAMYGAYGAGVCAELCRRLGNEYFDSVYASSVGVYAGTFFVAGQPEIIESTWRNHVHGRRLINPFRTRKILQLDYLEKIFQDDRSPLDVEAVFRSRTRLSYVLTKLADGTALYRSPDRSSIFRSMSASAATPLLHGAVEFDGEKFIDGALSDPLPVGKALQDGARLVVVVNNKPSDFKVPRSFKAFGYACRMLRGSSARLVSEFPDRVRETHRLLTDPRVLVIRPSSPLPLRSAVDTNWWRLRETVNLGVSDARKAMRELLRRP